MSGETFTYVVYINARAETVWEALTTGSFTEQYWGGRHIQSDWTLGASVRHLRPDGSFDWEGKVEQSDPPTLLSYSWNSKGIEPSRVTFSLKYQEPNTRLMVTHEGLRGDPQTIAILKEGWAAILSSLKTLLERGEALAYPSWRG
ncbi:MAG: ATPase [Chloroflexi bacterium]|nr:ATPase [Chloroflexota bacterium]